MGKRGGKKFGRGRGGGRVGQRGDYREIPKENVHFENYYNNLNGIEEDERVAFWAVLRTDLPNSFRFAGSKGHALSVRNLLKERYIPEISAIDMFDGQKVIPPFPVPWYPDQLAWQMNTSKTVVRRYPPFASFQKFLVSETSVGNISRQEVVSMIPPLLMDIRNGMTVLDLCAAPGSKAAQLMEMLHAGEEARIRQNVRERAHQEGREISPDGEAVKADRSGPDQEIGPDDGRATGLLIANDADYKRSHMLIHQMKRLNSPNLIITNHDATMFPSLRLPPEQSDEGRPPKIRYLKFDRILADVPCSGDGTVRKNPNVWKDWNPGNALGLYVTQVRILVRALQMLKVGGRVIYSTCSMNPIENEAVVASAIGRCGGPSNVSIIDVSNEIPGLKRKPGLLSWKVMDKNGRIWNSWEEIESHVKESGLEGPARLKEAMFPPKLGGDIGASQLPLDRCMRIYGHLQDTGAFFVSVLEKRSEIRARPESESKKAAPTPSIVNLADSIAGDEGNAKDPIHRIEILDQVLPPSNENYEGSSAAARQNQDNFPHDTNGVAKRAMDDEDEEQEEATAAKRLRLRDDQDEALLPGEEERQVHFPPPPAAKVDQTRPGPPPPQQRSKTSQKYEDPYKYLSPEHEELSVIYDFYDISPRFPRNRFMVRNSAGEPVKTIYYTTELARDILTLNEGKGIKFVHCGVKMFMKQDVQKAGTCKWRIQTEGLPILESWVGEKRVVRLYKQSTLRKLLIEMFPKVTNDGWRDLGEIGERVSDIELGCCVLRVETSDAEDGFRLRMALPLWRSLHSLNLMLPKEDRRAMLVRIFNDHSDLQPMRPNTQREQSDSVLEGEDEDSSTPVATIDGENATDAADLAEDSKMAEAPISVLREDDSES